MSLLYIPMGRYRQHTRNQKRCSRNKYDVSAGRTSIGKSDSFSGGRFREYEGPTPSAVTRRHAYNRWASSVVVRILSMIAQRTSTCKSYIAIRRNFCSKDSSTSSHAILSIFLFAVNVDGVITACSELCKMLISTRTNHLPSGNRISEIVFKCKNTALSSVTEGMPCQY